MIFFHTVSLFFSPLGHAIIVLLLQTVYWGENMARGKSNHIFPLDTIFFCDSICVFQLGENICVFICFLLGHAINGSTFTGGVLGEKILSLCANVFPLCLCFPPQPCCMEFTLPSFLDSFLDMSLRKNDIIFSPLVQFFSYL